MKIDDLLESGTLESGQPLTVLAHTVNGNIKDIRKEIERLKEDIVEIRDQVVWTDPEDVMPQIDGKVWLLVNCCTSIGVIRGEYRVSTGAFHDEYGKHFSTEGATWKIMGWKGRYDK